MHLEFAAVTIVSNHFALTFAFRSIMEFLTVLLLLVGPEIVLSTSLYSAIVADHQNRCPPRDKTCLPEGEYYQNDTTDCCGYCNCDLTECSKYGTCCLKAYGSIEEARESIPHTLLVYNYMSIQLS